MWGIHNDVFGQELIDGGFVSVGWDEIPDLTTVGPDRERIKALLRERRSYTSEGAVRNAAGVLYRFAFEMAEGDLVVAPNKADGTLGFALVGGPYEHHPDEPTHTHRRRVDWLKTGVARSHFSRAALAEIGAQMTLFRVTANDEEFRAFVDASPEDEELFRGEPYVGQPGDPVRHDLTLVASLRVLDEAGGGPVPKAEILRGVFERIENQLTEHEKSIPEGGTTTRWQNGLAWGSTKMKAAGWIDKTPEGWVLTDLGRAALEANPEGEGLAREANRLYRLDMDARRATSPRYAEALDALVARLPAGMWTSYSDLADAVGTNAQTVGGYMAQSTVEGYHRVVGKDGKPSPAFKWVGEPRAETQQEALEVEGVRFDANARADDAQRVHVGDLREILDKIDMLPRPKQRAWLVKGTSGGDGTVALWLANGVVSLRAASLRAVEGGATRDELKVIVAEDYADSSYAAKAAKVDEFHAFLTTMQVGDVVAATQQNRLYVGTVTGDTEFGPSLGGRANLTRTVDWVETGIEYAELPKSLRARLNTQADVLDITRDHDNLVALMSRVGPGPDPEPVTTRALGLPDATASLADALHVDRSWLQECIDLLRDRPQLIFYGPPGTGKTYLATALAEHLAGDNVRLVQFHPAYSYEDFFEGYRPDPSGGFTLRPGPLRKTVDAARENPQTPYFLVIDEINRGNLAKVFGELYFLLEYRDRTVDLLYASDDEQGFNLPENVFIIGTMNTADRSIALVDAAMRRRFSFLPLHPDEMPTRGVLRRWLARTQQPSQVADLMDALNDRIEDPDFRIGPSYFMRDAVHQPGGLERTWRTAILPLLEEFHYGDGTDVRARYGLDAIRRGLGPAEEPTGDDDATDAG